jgi:hypothetical protein
MKFLFCRIIWVGFDLVLLTYFLSLGHFILSLFHSNLLGRRTLLGGSVVVCCVLLILVRISPRSILFVVVVLVFFLFFLFSYLVSGTNEPTKPTYLPTYLLVDDLCSSFIPERKCQHYRNYFDVFRKVVQALYVQQKSVRAVCVLCVCTVCRGPCLVCISMTTFD